MKLFFSHNKNNKFPTLKKSKGQNSGTIKCAESTYKIAETTLNNAENILKNDLSSDDITFNKIEAKCGTFSLIYIKTFVDKKTIGELIIKPLLSIEKGEEKNILSHIYSPESKKLTSTIEAKSEIVNGNVVLLKMGDKNEKNSKKGDKNEKTGTKDRQTKDKTTQIVAYSFGLKKVDGRSIAEPPTSTVIKGPREGFIENAQTNIGLMRKKIKNENLVFREIKLGDISKTTIYVSYIKGLASDNLIKNVLNKLKNVDTTAPLDSSYLSKQLGERKQCLFKQIGNTEKPDILASKLLEGRVAIFVDGSPIVLTVPYLLIEDFQSPSDYYSSKYNATFSRIVRLISVVLALLLPALFVSAELFHLQLIPLAFLLTIENSIKGIPLSPSYEMFFTLLIFETLNEASVRMPRYVGMVVSIVGALVLGETAVNAGIISAPTLMIVALSGICLYTVPELEQTFSIIRLILLIVAGAVGVFGVFVALNIIVIYLLSLENFNTPILAPFSPMLKKDLSDGFIKNNNQNITTVPISFRKS